MPVWIKHRMTIPEWGAAQYRLLILQQETRAQLAMLIRAGDSGQPDDVFVALPDSELLSRFAGFTAVDEADIPTGVALLVGAGPEFAERFPQVALKLRGLRI
jgi:hypothetical protein